MSGRGSHGCRTSSCTRSGQRRAKEASLGRNGETLPVMDTLDTQSIVPFGSDTSVDPRRTASAPLIFARCNAGQTARPETLRRDVSRFGVTGRNSVPITFRKDLVEQDQAIMAPRGSIKLRGFDWESRGAVPVDIQSAIQHRTELGLNRRHLRPMHSPGASRQAKVGIRMLARELFRIGTQLKGLNLHNVHTTSAARQAAIDFRRRTSRSTERRCPGPVPNPFRAITRASA